MTEFNHTQDPAELVIRYSDPRPALQAWTTSALKERPRGEVAEVLRGAAGRHTGTPAAALLDALAEEAEAYGAVGHRERLDASADADPVTAQYGVRTDDPWASGLAVFSFFESPQARASALLDDFPFLEVAGPGEEPQHTWVPARTALEKLLERDATAEAINAVTKDRFAVAWIGTFDDLCTGSDAVASEAREDFWLNIRNDESTDAIGADNRADFADFVRERGG